MGRSVLAVGAPGEQAWLVGSGLVDGDGGVRGGGLGEQDQQRRLDDGEGGWGRRGVGGGGRARCA